MKEIIQISGNEEILFLEEWCKQKGYVLEIVETKYLLVPNGQKLVRRI